MAPAVALAASAISASATRAPCRTSVEDGGVEKAPAASHRSGPLYAVESPHVARGGQGHRRTTLIGAAPGAGIRVPHECCVPGEWLRGRERPFEVGFEVDRDHDPREEATDGVRTLVPARECPPRRSNGAGEEDAATTTSSISAASRCPPKVRYSFETPSRSTSRIRPQEKSSDRGILVSWVNVRREPRPTLGHPIVDRLRIVVLQRRRLSKRHEKERRAGPVRQVRVGKEPPNGPPARRPWSPEAR